MCCILSENMTLLLTISLLVLFQGDMSIGSYVGVPKQTRSVEQDDFANQGVPEQPGGFTEIDLSYDSECVVTAATFGAPTCSYLFKMVFCREKNKGSIRKDACRLGSFSAYGKGPSKIHITGGTDDFVGAFGEVRLVLRSALRSIILCQSFCIFHY